MNLHDMPELELAWYGKVLGKFKVVSQMGGIRWESTDNDANRLFDGVRGDQAPTLLRFLTPEGWLNKILDEPDMSEYLKGIRYLSNLTISTDTQMLRNRYDLDRVMVSLDSCMSPEGVYEGEYDGPCPKSIGEKFEEQLAAYWTSRAMPKFSGVQMKLPVTLNLQGDGTAIMQPAQKTQWSHIMKFPGTSYHAPLAALEWMGLEMAEGAGLKTAKHALVPLPIGLPPAVIVERFDIPQHDDDKTHYLIADFCTLTGKDPAIFKYGTPAETLAKKMMEITSDKDADSVAMLQRHAFAWFGCDSDMHMKNISVLKEYNPETKAIKINLAPVYDTLPTIVLPSKGDQTLSLPVGGKNSNLSINNFIQLGSTLGIDEDRVIAIVRDVAEKTAKRAVEIAANPPEAIADHPKCAFAVKHAATEIVGRVKAFGFDVPEWDPVRPDKQMRKDMRAFAAETGPSLVMG